MYETHVEVGVMNGRQLYQFKSIKCLGLHTRNQMTLSIHYSGGSRISQKSDANSREGAPTYYSEIVYRKVPENERNSTKRGPNAALKSATALTWVTNDCTTKCLPASGL